MNLAYKYPHIFWDTANLIVDSGSMNLEQEFEENDTEKIENSAADYGKIAMAIGKMKTRGLSFSLPNINTSDITFSPDLKNNRILYGLRGITRVGNQVIKDIIDNRPYESIEDFQNKIKINKTQMINLIKSGAFDELYNIPRKEIMDLYLNSIADKKKRITMQNMAMLIRYNLIPDELDFEVKVFNFNKYLKNHKHSEYYFLDSISYNFYIENFDVDNLIKKENQLFIKQTIWDSIYSMQMDKVRVWMKENQKDILNNLNQLLFDEIKKNNAEGSISKWEMDSLNFYYHKHELFSLNKRAYNIESYFDLSDEPEIENEFLSKDGHPIHIYKLSRIAGTVIDKNKNKNTVTLLTLEGVVTVKIWKNQFTKWDKQISEVDSNGDKHIVERSWFKRGNKLIITGIRREGCFIPKKYRNTPSPLFERIIKMDEDGFIIESQTERFELEE